MDTSGRISAVRDAPRYIDLPVITEIVTRSRGETMILINSTTSWPTLINARKPRLSLQLPILIGWWCDKSRERRVDR